MYRQLKSLNHWSREWNLLSRTTVLFALLSCSCVFANLNAGSGECPCSHVESSPDSQQDAPSDDTKEEVQPE